MLVRKDSESFFLWERERMNTHVIVRSASQSNVSEHPWGCLVWHASKALGNSATMTIGRCEIKPGCENPRHYHPDCEEILVVLSGTIMHTADGMEDVAMQAGDCIVVPAGISHNARNTGTDMAILSIAFSSPDRKTIPVDPAAKDACR